MILSFINIRKVPREMLKTSGIALGFQHLPRDVANVNEWKTMFDPYIAVISIQIFSKIPHAKREVPKNEKKCTWSSRDCICSNFYSTNHLLKSKKHFASLYGV